MCDFVRLGKSLRFKMYRKCVTMKGACVSDFSTCPNAMQQKRIDRHNKNATTENGDDPEIESWLLEHEMLEQQQRLEDRTQSVVYFLFFPFYLFLTSTIDATQSADPYMTRLTLSRAVKG